LDANGREIKLEASSLGVQATSLFAPLEKEMAQDCWRFPRRGRF
jgi:hypothetical protein